jgi:hypothetical protein
MLTLLPSYRVGDVLDTLLSIMVLRSATKVEGGLPASVMIPMLLNVIFDFVVGIIPFIGDVADAAFRANTRNAALLESHLREKGKKNLRKSGMPLPAIDPSLGEEFDRVVQHEESGYTSSQPGQQEGMTTNGRNGNGASGEAVPRPEPAKTSKGFFGRRRDEDVETGRA